MFAYHVGVKWIIKWVFWSNN